MTDVLDTLKSALNVINPRDFEYGDEDPAQVLAALRERGFDVFPVQAFRRVDGSVQPEAEALFWSLRENVREHLDPEMFATVASDANLDRVLAALQGRGCRIVPVEKA